jgi:hypothetical protein
MRHFSASSLLCAAAALLSIQGAVLAQPSSTWIYGALPASDKYASKIFPVSRAIACPRVVIDTTEAPECTAWAVEARRSVEEWFPIVSQYLATNDYNAPGQITLFFVPTKSMTTDVPAYTYPAGATMYISSDYVKGHQDDFGMVIHEMVHIFQPYANAGKCPSWLSEGIADYIRYYRYEPEVLRNTRFRYYANTIDYHHGYDQTAAFLSWIIETHNRQTLYLVDESCRNGTYSDDIWKSLTGESLDDLWAEFLKTLPTRTLPTRK